MLIRRGLAALDRAIGLGGAQGPYVLQASIAACHARARKAADTDWRAIAGYYDRLAEVAPSPVVELNRAVAHSMAYGPAQGLALLDAVAEAPALRNYHLLPSVRGDFLVKLGRPSEARAEFERAAALTRNERERALLLDRARSCAA
jgi:predicted RNA polymerase sigma factor